ncbi:Type II secretion system protein F [Candidatus Magnetaquicoccaceae bacterium FCR-1]|uniref:General secretion pathway protein F n=1 Tax=Candidatus Magnetaquiglobus chichijimensis TaxID=3141448 RepID=A0ABQ0C6L8_9PROT
MAVFRYEGMRAGGGRTVKGVLDADTERDARRLLKQQEIYPTLLERLEGSETSKRSPRRWSFKRGAPLPPMREKIVFTRQMASLLAAGFPVMEVLSSVEEQIRTGPFREVVATIRNDVGEGLSLSEALGRHERIFPPLYVSLVRAGERGGGGALDTIFERLAVVMEEERRIRARLISAMIYPAVMAIVGGMILIFMMTVVVPKVTTVFKETQQALPMVTRSLLAISDYLRDWGVWSAVALVIGMLVLAGWARSSKGRARLEGVWWRVPLLGELLSSVATMRVCQLLGLLLKSGVPVIGSLQVTADATGFVTVRSGMLEVAKAVERGDSLAEALERTGHFQGLAIRMIKAGERSGSLEAMLERAARLHREEIEQTLERLMHLVEPVIILVMGGVVGYVVVAVLLPIFEMNQFIK